MNLNDVLVIGDAEFSREGARFREWKWKGGSVPFEVGSCSYAMGYETTLKSAVEEK